MARRWLRALCLSLVLATHAVRLPVLPAVARARVKAGAENHTSGLLPCGASSIDALVVCVHDYYQQFVEKCLKRRCEYRSFERTVISNLRNVTAQSATTRTEDVVATVQQAVLTAGKFLSAPRTDIWKSLGEEDGMRVWKLKAPFSGYGDVSQWPCLKAHTTVDLPMERLADVLMDSTKAHLLNKYSIGRTDIESFGAYTKIVWTRTKIPLAIKPYDFCTLMHRVDEPENQRILIISKATTHSRVPEGSDFARSEIMFGMNILRPCPSDCSKTDFTLINHVRYAGVPTFLASRSCYPGTMSFLKRLRAAALKLQSAAPDS